MKYKAVDDNAKVIAKYQKANPSTQLVQVIQSPSQETVTGWNQAKFLIAVYPTESALKDQKVKNAFVLPITADDYNKLELNETE